MLMRNLWSAAMLLAASADAQGIKAAKIIRKKPELSTAKDPQTTQPPTSSLASSVINYMYSQKHAGGSSPASSSLLISTTTSISSKTSKSVKTTSLAKTTGLVKTTLKVTKKPRKKTTTTTTTTTKTKLKKKPKATKAAESKHAHVPRQADTCVQQTLLYGYQPSPDTPDGFLMDQTLYGLAQLGSLYPAGYSVAFTNQVQSISASGYVGYYPLASYDPSACANICNGVSSCQAFNIYFQRVPTLSPGDSCPNPVAAAEVYCTLYNSTIDVSQATNVGQWRDDFMVVTQGSDGYNKNPALPQPAGYGAAIPLAGAIDVSSNVALAASFISATFYASDGLDPQLCADLCTAASFNFFNPCQYFNAVEISVFGISQGTYCQLYSTDVTYSAGLYSSLQNGLTYDVVKSWGFLINGAVAATTTTSAPPAATSVYAPTGALPSFGITTTTKSTTTTTKALTSATPLIQTCGQIANAAGSGTYTSLNGNVYSVKCNMYLYGYNELGTSSPGKNFSDCFTLCDVLKGCNAFMLNFGICYFRSLTGVTATPFSSMFSDMAWLQGVYPGGASVL